MFLDVKGIQGLTNILMSDCYFTGNRACTGAAM